MRVLASVVLALAGYSAVAEAKAVRGGKADVRKPKKLADDVVDPGFVSKTAKAVLKKNGVTGTVTFTQENWTAPVVISVDLKLPETALPAPYHVHRLPVMIAGDCGPNSTAGHWNPLNVSATYTACEDPLLCEAGDLSTKHGPLNDTEVQSSYSDDLITLYGFNSIVGRSVVVHATNGTRLACGSLQLVETPVKKAKAVFSGAVEGYVLLTQVADNPLADTSILMDLKVAGGKAGSKLAPNGKVSFHVHSGAVTERGTCEGVGKHLNPLALPACTVNNTSPFNGCDLGDLVGRHAPVSLPASGATTAFITDYLPLSGDDSVIGNTFAIHVPKLPASSGKRAKTGGKDMDMDMGDGEEAHMDDGVLMLCATITEVKQEQPARGRGQGH